MQIKSVQMNVITNSNSNTDHSSQDRINHDEQIVAISTNNKSEAITNIAVDEYLFEDNEATNTVDSNDEHNYYTSSSDSNDNNNDSDSCYSDSNRNDFFIERENIAESNKKLTFAEKLADSCSRTNMNHV